VFFTAGFSTKEPILIAISLSESGGWFTLVGVLSVSFTLVYSMRILRSLAGVTSNRICRHLSNIPLAISLMLGVLSSIVIQGYCITTFGLALQIFGFGSIVGLSPLQ
jgi:hypothetical protein